MQYKLINKNHCSKNGIKKEGESCTLNNNCTFPSCVIDEIWKDIPGYEGLYQVSNLGRVKNLNNFHTKQEKILKPLNHPKGYLRVALLKKVLI